MQRMNKMQKQNQYLINKTEILEKGIIAFPSLFIEGAAACGKTTAMEMLLESHSEAESEIIFMDEEWQDLASFCAHLSMCELYMCEKRAGKPCWVIFENIRHNMPSEFAAEIARFIWNLPENGKVFLLSREKPARELLELLWKHKMFLISQNSLVFSQTEVEKLISQRKSGLRAEDVYRQTGGWPGCVDVILHLSEQLREKDVKKLCQRYEVQAYIQNEISDTLSNEESEILRRASVCPWINEMLCEEVWGILWPAEVLKDLERKGLLLYNEYLHRWKAAPLFRKENQELFSFCLGKRLGEWYELQGAVLEAMWCLRAARCEKEYQECVIMHFEQVPLSFMVRDDVMEWGENIPQLCYLRGMHHYYEQDFNGLHRELQKTQQLEGDLAKEVYLNLAFADPQISMEVWMTLLEELTRDRVIPVRLYHFTENTHTFLSGLRELSALFSCAPKEEKRRMKLLKEKLIEEAWRGIQLARLDYYLETERRDSIQEEDWETVVDLVNASMKSVPWQYRIACLYLLNKMQSAQYDVETAEYIEKLEKSLQIEESESCQNYFQAICKLYAPLKAGDESLARWLKNTTVDISVDETNYNILLFQTKGYLFLNQHDKAERILRKLIPYLQKYRRSRFLAELLFQQAIIHWAEGKRGASLRNVIESFLVAGDSRYVGFYASYGKFGKEVLDAYVEWLRSNEPERWHKKRKYSYGNVLRMPREDYFGVLQRVAKRGIKPLAKTAEKPVVERLTMMETIILQDINKGLTNAEICEELNLKMPTVKSHIYSAYKKLGVNSRVQAILKGKELGIVK